MGATQPKEIVLPPPSCKSTQLCVFNIFNCFVKADKPRLDSRHMIWEYSCTRERVDKYVELCAKIFNPHLSAIAANCIQWLLPSVKAYARVWPRRKVYQ